MTNAVVTRIGQINAAGDTDALFLKVFPGEVLSAYNTKNKMMGRHIVRTIASGKSAQFPASGTASASYHTPGVQLVGSNTIRHAERVIYIDSELVAEEFVAKIDEAMNHYDIRGEYAKQLGEALAKKGDQQLLQVGVLAARSSATVTGGNGGSTIVNAAARTDGAILGSLAYDAAQAFDEKDVPEDERSFYVLPAQYYLLVETDKMIDRDFSGGNGDFAMAKVFRAAGMEIVKTNNIPQTVVAAESGVNANNTYDGTFTNVAALAMHRSAIGTVKLLDLSMEKEYQLNRRGTLMVASYAMGHGILRPECAVEVSVA